MRGNGSVFRAVINTDAVLLKFARCSEHPDLPNERFLSKIFARSTLVKSLMQVYASDKLERQSRFQQLHLPDLICFCFQCLSLLVQHGTDPDYDLEEDADSGRQSNTNSNPCCCRGKVGLLQGRNNQNP